MQLIRLLIVLLPWPLKRRVLTRLFGFELDPTSYIGLSWIYPRKSLRLLANSRIGHGNICRSLDELELGAESTIGSWNWLTGWSTAPEVAFFADEVDRRSRLSVGTHSAITARHYIDCANTVTIGSFTTLAGVRSVVWSHEINVDQGKQTSRPVEVGDYCYVGTCSVLLPGAVIPNRSVIAAGAVVRGVLGDELRVYGGVPAKAISELSPDARYFSRHRGVVL
jgi:serine acetyltransferase